MTVADLIHDGEIYTGDGAIFSLDRRHRYLLTRRLSFQFSTCLFIMLNPSTADATINDPTVAKCIKFAQRWGYGVLEVCNIFAWRSTDPKKLYGLSYADAVGRDNDRNILEAISRGDRIVCAWGNHGDLHGRGLEVRDQVLMSSRIPLVFKINKGGQPIHPLYQKWDQPLIAWAA